MCGIVAAPCFAEGQSVEPCDGPQLLRRVCCEGCMHQGLRLGVVGLMTLHTVGISG